MRGLNTYFIIHNDVTLKVDKDEFGTIDFIGVVLLDVLTYIAKGVVVGVHKNVTEGSDVLSGADVDDVAVLVVLVLLDLSRGDIHWREMNDAVVYCIVDGHQNIQV